VLGKQIGVARKASSSVSLQHPVQRHIEVHQLCWANVNVRGPHGTPTTVTRPGWAKPVPELGPTLVWKLTAVSHGHTHRTANLVRDLNAAGKAPSRLLPDRYLATSQQQQRDSTIHINCTAVYSYQGVQSLSSSFDNSTMHASVVESCCWVYLQYALC